MKTRRKDVCTINSSQNESHNTEKYLQHNRHLGRQTNAHKQNNYYFYILGWRNVVDQEDGTTWSLDL